MNVICLDSRRKSSSSCHQSTDETNVINSELSKSTQGEALKDIGRDSFLWTI